ncbi:hypothetical protein FRC06_002400 [Ceratobasidium sp. 370]|nr:hypothetical protein FRC06_002400 [Ceratobasidium sp. 370]
MSNHADVTAIVLNYARLENVKVIVAHMCSEQLRDTICHIIVWNNNIHHPLSVMVRNFIAAREVYMNKSQDDDYLISAEAIRALRMYSRLNQAAGDQYPIHLLPPHEHLSTTIRTRATDKYTASFAWLGHGTLLTRTHARDFLSLLRAVSDNRDDVMKMADNFFSILFNHRAEIWIDPGIRFEAGQDKAFTAGVEGDERNWRYIGIAEKYLESITARPELVPDNGFGVFPTIPSGQLITRAPVLAPGHGGLWLTNIPMLRPGILEAGLAGNDLQSTDRLCRDAMTELDIERYTQNNLACIGDGLISTVFRSPGGCQEGQWLQFDLLDERPVSSITFRWRVEPGFAKEVQQMSYETLEAGQSWVKHTSKEAEPTGENSFAVHLEMDHPTSLIAAKAIAGAGTHARPAWAIVACCVETAH